MKWQVVSSIERHPKNPRTPRVAVIDADSVAPDGAGGLLFVKGEIIVAAFAQGSYSVCEIANETGTAGAGFVWHDEIDAPAPPAGRG